MHGTVHDNYPLPCPLLFFSEARTVRHTSPLPSSAPSPALCARTVQSNAQSLPDLSPPSPALLRFSGILSSFVCLVCAYPSRPARDLFPLPCLPSLHDTTQARCTLHFRGRAALWQHAAALRLVLCPRALWAACSVVGHLFAPAPYPLSQAAVACNLHAEQCARQRSLSAPPLCPGPLALSCPLSARPPSPFPAPLPWLQSLAGVSGLLSLCPLLLSSPPACTVQSNVRGNPPTLSIPFCPLASWSLGQLHALCTAPACGLFSSSPPSLVA